MSLQMSLMEYVFEDDLIAKEISERELDTLIIYVTLLGGVVNHYNSHANNQVNEIKTGKEILNNARKIEYNSEELSNYAMQYRKESGITSSSRNVCVVKYTDNSGNVKMTAFVSKSGVGVGRK